MRRDPILFRITPRVGKVMIIDGQRYVLVAQKLHYRQSDGEPTTILVWESSCAECGVPFETTTPLKVNYINRRCKKHRKPGRKVADAFRPNVRKGGAK